MTEPEPMTDAKVKEILAQTLYVDGAYMPFGEMTVAHARGRADELRAAVGFGPTTRVAPVARAWRQLTMELEREGVATVGELDPDAVRDLAPQLWIVPPGGSLL
ncbi:MAG: hypothetical protein M3Z06_10855 [Actinomycetota bacterium]|nr:hypothetical protein [Actinomycetota bacterium]